MYSTVVVVSFIPFSCPCVLCLSPCTVEYIQYLWHFGFPSIIRRRRGRSLSFSISSVRLIAVHTRPFTTPLDEVADIVAAIAAAEV